MVFAIQKANLVEIHKVADFSDIALCSKESSHLVMLITTCDYTSVIIFITICDYRTIIIFITLCDYRTIIILISTCDYRTIIILITSPLEGVARYCFHPVCLSVCVCVCLCVWPIFWYFISRLLEEISI